MAIRLSRHAALGVLLFGFSLGFAAQAAAQDPADVDAAASVDPARVGDPARAAPSRGSVPAVAVPPLPETMQRLVRAEDPQRRPAAQLGDGRALSPEQRVDMPQLLDRSGGLIDDAWTSLGRRTAGTASGMPESTRAAATAPTFDSLASLQHDPRLREGTQQAREEMAALQRTLLPMLQQLRDDVDAELGGAASRRR